MILGIQILMKRGQKEGEEQDVLGRRETGHLVTGGHNTRDDYWKSAFCFARI